MVTAMSTSKELASTALVTKRPSLLSILGATLAPLKVASMLVGTKEFFRSTSSATEARLRADLIRSHAEAIDAAFIDAANAGIADVMPAAVTAGVAAIPSTGSPGADIAALVENFAGNLSVAAFITDPATAAGIALARDASGSFQFPDASPRSKKPATVGLLLTVTRQTVEHLYAHLDALRTGFKSHRERLARLEQRVAAMESHVKEFYLSGNMGVCKDVSKK